MGKYVQRKSLSQLDSFRKTRPDRRLTVAAQGAFTLLRLILTANYDFFFANMEQIHRQTDGWTDTAGPLIRRRSCT